MIQKKHASTGILFDPFLNHFLLGICAWRISHTLLERNFPTFCVCVELVQHALVFGCPQPLLRSLNLLPNALQIIETLHHPPSPYPFAPAPTHLLLRTNPINLKLKTSDPKPPAPALSDPNNSPPALWTCKMTRSTRSSSLLALATDRDLRPVVPLGLRV